MSETRFICGFHAVTSKLRQDSDAVQEIYLAEQRQDARAKELVRQAQVRGTRVIVIDNARLEGMTGHSQHQGVAARISATWREPKLDDILETLAAPALLLVLDGVQDPHNLGACLRVADAAGAQAVIAPKDRAVGLNATVIKVACGAADTVPFVTVTNLARSLREIKERDIWTIGADADAKNALYDVELKGPVAWVLGAEGSGLRRLTRETCDELVRIPMFGSVESLNISVACGVCLFETRRQRAAA